MGMTCYPSPLDAGLMAALVLGALPEGGVTKEGKGECLSRKRNTLWSRDTSCYGSSHTRHLNPARRERMNSRRVVIVVLVLCGLSLSPVAAQQASPQKKPKVVKREPAGEYARCDENCPPPGLSAQRSEVWCATRVQC